MVGFTGVRWDARPAEKLSRDLSMGAGAKPMFEAGMSWAAIGVALRETASEFERLKKSILEGWKGRGDAGMIAAVEKLEKWVGETADMALRNAAAAERQAVAHTVAVAAMPDADAIAALGHLEDALKQVAAPPKSLMAGGLAELDHQATSMKAQAARVMESYEQATTPVSRPWDPVAAPAHLVDRSASDTVRSEAEARIAAQQAVGLSSEQAMLAAVAALRGTALGSYASDEYVSQTRRAELRADGMTAEEVVAVDGRASTAVPADAVSQHPHVLPAAPMGASASAGQPEHGAAAVATHYEDGREIVESGSQTAAPSVLGVSDAEGPR
ncbi:PPE domain-containing protein [Williamsia sp. SKLECPSW1]